MSDSVQSLVIADLRERQKLGLANYGAPMMADDQAFDWLVEAYQEQMDNLFYLKAEILRREAAKAAWKPIEMLDSTVVKD